MAERGTKEVLLRLRRARELELRRALAVQRAAQAEARKAGARAEAARRALEASLARTAARRTAAWTAPRRAGRLAGAEGYEGGLRQALRTARADEKRAAEALDAAEARVAAAQQALGDAVHVRQRSETMMAAERAADARTRERREHAEVEDRYRAPPRSAAPRKGLTPRGRDG